jgi:hypothetical protein
MSETPVTLSALLHHISDAAEAPWMKPGPEGMIEAKPDSVEDCDAFWRSWIEHELVELGAHIGAWKQDKKRADEAEGRLKDAVARFDAYHKEVTALVPEEWEPGTAWEHAPDVCEICRFLLTLVPAASQSSSEAKP